jgi:hypothetical protein
MKLSDEEVATAADALSRGDALTAANICISGSSFFDQMVTELGYILTRTPQVLGDCPDRILRPIRVAAGLWLLACGSSPIRRFITKDRDYNYRYTPETVTRLLSRHASYLLRRAQMTDAGIKTVKILPSGLPDVCSVCREISQRRFTVVDVPELPLTDCTSPDGCRCLLGAVA